MFHYVMRMSGSLRKSPLELIILYLREKPDMDSGTPDSVMLFTALLSEPTHLAEKKTTLNV